jgi:hypothetical protein
MGGWAQDALVALRERAAQLALIQAAIDSNAGVQAALTAARAPRGSIFTQAGREQFFTAARALKAALDAAGIVIPEGYTLDLDSGKLEKDSGGIGWLGWTLIGVGVGIATWGIGFGFAGLGGAGAATTGGTTAAAATEGGVLASSSIPLVSQVGHLAVPAAITSGGASAAVYGSAAAAAASAAIPATVGSTAAATGTSTAAAIARQVAQQAPRIASLFAPDNPVPDTGIPLYTPEALSRPASLDSLLKDPLILAALAGVVIVAFALARR